MGLPIVWGTRVKEAAIGVVAVRCPHCGELTCADCFKTTSASHVYFITAEYREAGKYAKCRLCGVPQLLPANSHPIPNLQPDRIHPDSELIEQTNPAVAQSASPPLMPGVGFPVSVTRPQWALVRGIAEEIRRQQAVDKLGGNIPPLYILTLVFSVFGGVILWVQLEHKSKLVPLLLLGLSASTLLVLIYLLEGFLLNRILHREAGRYVRASLKQKSATMQSLIDASVAMGAKYRRVTTYLRWAQNRIGPE